MNIAVYCGSVFGKDPEHALFAEKLGSWIGKNGHTLVYGGSKTGLMGVVADAALLNGGKVIGVLPDVELIHEREHKGLSEYIYTKTMAQRREKMMDLSDAYIALPGGYGTLDEISEILCMIRLELIDRPAVLVNINGYYDGLKHFTDKMIVDGYVGGEEMKRRLFSDDFDEITKFIAKG